MNISVENLKALDEKSLEIYCKNTKKKQKSKVMFYILWYVGSHFGMHNFYLKRKDIGIIQCVLGIISMGISNVLEINSSIIDMANITNITDVIFNGGDLYNWNLILESFNIAFILQLGLIIWVIVDLFLADKLINDLNKNMELEEYNKLFLENN